MNCFSQKLKGILSTIGAFLTYFNMGSIYSSGLISPFYISYLHSFNNSIKVEDGFWFFPTASLVSGIFGLLGCYFDHKIGTKL